MDYLATIDWPMAVVVGLAAIAIAFVVNWFLQEAASEVIHDAPTVNDRLALAILGLRRNAPRDAWLCPGCKSINLPAQGLCYHCGAERFEPEVEPGPLESASAGDSAGESVPE